MFTETGYAKFLRDLPHDWQTAQISAISKIVGGGTPSRNVPAFWGGDIPWVTPGEVSRWGPAYLKQTRERITATGLASSGATLIPAGSLMVTTRATLGARAINAVAMTTNQGFRSLVFNSSADAPFYYYLTEKLSPELKRRASGTTFLEVSGTELAKIEVPVPPVRERRLIAEILETLDTTIRQTEAIIEKLKHVKQGLLHDLLTRGIDANGELRPAQSEAPHLYKESPLGWIPREWALNALGAMAEIVGGVTLGRSVTGIGTLELPYLRVANVQDGYLDLDEVKTTRILSSELSRFRLEIGDVLMNEGGDFDKLGRGVMWSGEIDTCLHQNHVFRVRSQRGELDPRYLTAYSSSGFGKAFFLQASKQTTNLASINSTQLKAFPLRLPQLAEQKAIIDGVAAIQSRIETERADIKKARLLKSGVMDDLLTGRVRVTSLL